MGLFRSGDFTLHSGEHSPFKIDCDGLTGEDWEALAALAAALLPPFSAVYGVPRGGVRFAAALQKHATPGAWPLLIVDDVLTTGASMEEAQAGAGRPAVGCVVFARGRCPRWVVPLFVMTRGGG
jgi:orotate phosphoribosyltransferase